MVRFYWLASVLTTALLLAWLGVSRAQPVPATGADDSISLTVQVDAQARGGGKRHPVKPGEVLNAGDQIALRIKADRDAFLYVAHAVSDGRYELLFSPRAVPGNEAPFLRVTAQVETHLPPGDATLELEADTREEDLYVVASIRPLPQSDPALYQRLSASSPPPTAAPAPPPPPRPPPEPIKPTDRVPGEGGLLPHAVRVRASRGGVAIARFTVRLSGEKPRPSASGQK